MSNKEFHAWREAAAKRSTIKLMDGSDAILIAARKTTQSVKVYKDARFWHCWVDDVALVKVDGIWSLLPPWPAQPLKKDRDARSLRAPDSKNWLKVERNPRLLHPSFLPRDSD